MCFFLSAPLAVQEKERMDRQKPGVSEMCSLQAGVLHNGTGNKQAISQVRARGKWDDLTVCTGQVAKAATRRQGAGAEASHC